MADNLILAYGLGEWKTNLYEFGPAGTASLRALESGTADAVFVFLGYFTNCDTLTGAAGGPPGPPSKTGGMTPEISKRGVVQSGPG